MGENKCFKAYLMLNWSEIQLKSICLCTNLCYPEKVPCIHICNIFGFKSLSKYGLRHLTHFQSRLLHPYICVSSWFLSPAAPKAQDGRYCNAPRPSVCLSVRLSVCPSVTFSFRTVTQKCSDVFSQNFAGMCTVSWGCAV